MVLEQGSSIIQMTERNKEGCLDIKILICYQVLSNLESVVSETLLLLLFWIRFGKYYGY